jgi:hypothetical protein
MESGLRRLLSAYAEKAIRVIWRRSLVPSEIL